MNRPQYEYLKVPERSDQPPCQGSRRPAAEVRVLGVPHPRGTCAVCGCEFRLDGAGHLPEHAAARAEPVS
jgi:hypothetical protein